MNKDVDVSYSKEHLLTKDKRSINEATFYEMHCLLS